MAQYIGLLAYILTALELSHVEPTPTPTIIARIPNSPTAIARPTIIPSATIIRATQQPTAPTNAGQSQQPPSRGEVVRATRYGESFNGRTMGCGGTYSSANPNILAVPPSRYSTIPCGTRVNLYNPSTGLSLQVVRTDACPGCGHNHIDLSEAGIAALCGSRCDTISGLIMTVP